MLPSYVMVILYCEQSALRYIQVKLDINRHCWQKCVCSILMSYLRQSCSNIHFSYIITGWSKCKMLAGVADQKRRIANSSHIIVSECALRWGLEKGRVSNQWQCFPSPRELPYPQRATFHAKAKVARLGLSQRYIFLCNIFVHGP